MYDAQVLSMGK